MTALPVEHRFVSASDGLRLHVRDVGPRDGAATPVVCLPGLARTAADFDPLADALARGAAGAPRRVLSLDYRGRGLSGRDANWRNYDLAVENADLLACLDALEISQAVIVGTSRGGLHCLMLAATRPTMMRAVVMNDIGPVIESTGLARIRGYVGKLPPPRSWEDAVDIAKRVMSAQFPALTEEDWLAYARLTFEEQDGPFTTRYDVNLMKPLAEFDLEAALPTAWPQFEGLAHAPVLVVRGENSDLLSQETANEMTRRHPRCELHVVPGQGHAPLLRDAPTIERIAAFIAANG